MFAGISGGVLVNLGTPRASRGMPPARPSPREPPGSSTPSPSAPCPCAPPSHTSSSNTDPRSSAGTRPRSSPSREPRAAGRGVDATDSAEDALDAARSLAIRTGGTVAVSGETDLIVDATRTARVTGGSALLTKVTGGGCALGAAMASLLAVAPAFDAASAPARSGPWRRSGRHPEQEGRGRSRWRSSTNWPRSSPPTSTDASASTPRSHDDRRPVPAPRHDHRVPFARCATSSTRPSPRA